MAEKEESPEDVETGVAVSGRMLTLFFVGFAVIVVGIILVVLASALSGGSGSVGGVIFIGPFPIVFGAGPDATWLIVISLVIAVLMLVLFFAWRRRYWKLEA
jgi:uncharacterized membrane protein